MSSVSTGSSITDKFTQISRSPPAYQTTNVNHMTQISPITNTSPKSQSTTGSHVSEQPSSTRFLYQKQTTAGSLLHDRAASTLHDGKIFRPYLKKKSFLKGPSSFCEQCQLQQYLSLFIPLVPETFLARFPVSVKSL